jgi:hypothetical protein
MQSSVFDPTHTNAQIDGITAQVIKKSKLGFREKSRFVGVKAPMSKRMLELCRSDRRFPKARTQSGPLQEEGSDTDHTGKSAGDLVGGCGTSVLWYS